jgi:hypothetical protein
VITFKAPSGTKLTATEKEAAAMEALIRRIVKPEDLGSTYRKRPFNQSDKARTVPERDGPGSKAPARSSSGFKSCSP